MQPGFNHSPVSWLQVAISHNQSVGRPKKHLLFRQHHSATISTTSYSSVLHDQPTGLTTQRTQNRGRDTYWGSSVLMEYPGQIPILVGPLNAAVDRYATASAKRSSTRKTSKRGHQDTADATPGGIPTWSAASTTMSALWLRLPLSPGTGSVKSTAVRGLELSLRMSPTREDESRYLRTSAAVRREDTGDIERRGNRAGCGCSVIVFVAGSLSSYLV